MRWRGRSTARARAWGWRCCTWRCSPSPTACSPALPCGASPRSRRARRFAGARPRTLESPHDLSRTRRPRLRRTQALRDLVRESELAPGHLIQPLFVVAGEGLREPVASMPGIERFSISELVGEAAEVAAAGIRAVILFGIPADK